MTRSTTITPKSNHDYYEILNLPSNPTSSSTLSKQQFKLAYHKALLQHHPDKTPSLTPHPTHTHTHTQSNSNSNSNSNPPATPTFTIDEITTAYKTLSDPSLRAEYDRLRRLDRASSARGGEKAAAAFHTGLEVVDLEDLECEERADKMQWFRACRCGDERGFLVTEAELEKEVEQGEVVVGCQGCSLWMKVLFAVEGGEG